MYRNKKLLELMRELDCQHCGVNIQHCGIIYSMKKSTDKFGLNKLDFKSYEEYRKEYNRLQQQTDYYKEWMKKYNRSEAGKQRQKKYYHSEKYKQKTKKYTQSEYGRGANRARSAKRHTNKLQRTPVWAELDLIKNFYLNCPKGYHVDHIIPLQGEKVSGLHVLSNLQYLTQSENCSKGNSF